MSPSEKKCRVKKMSSGFFGTFVAELQLKKGRGTLQLVFSMNTKKKVNLTAPVCSTLFFFCLHAKHLTSLQYGIRFSRCYDDSSIFLLKPLQFQLANPGNRPKYHLGHHFRTLESPLQISITFMQIVTIPLFLSICVNRDLSSGTLFREFVPIIFRCASWRSMSCQLQRFP